MQAFTQHPRSVGENYLEHFAKAWRFGVVLVGAGLACCVHALLPFLFETTASRLVRSLNAELQARRAAAGDPAAASSV